MLSRILNRKNKHYKKYMGAKMYIADMETDGVYFSDEQRKLLEEYRDRMFCSYSGLPSVSAYSDIDNFSKTYSK